MWDYDREISIAIYTLCIISLLVGFIIGSAFA